MSADLVEIEVHGLGTTGDGVGRLPNGRVVFVEGAFPGDRVRVRLAERRKKVQYGDLIELVRPSLQRVSSGCGVEQCGGCALRALSSQGQSSAKRRRVVETMRRIAKVDVEDLLGTIRQVGQSWGYRHRVRLHAVWAKNAWRLGYHARRSRDVVPYEGCPVLWQELDAVVQRAVGVLARLPRNAQLVEVEIAHSRIDNRAACRLRGHGPVDAYRAIFYELLDIGLFGSEVTGREGTLRFGNLELRYDHHRSGEFDLRFEPGVFTQANPAVNDRLVDAVLTAVRPREARRILELHAGMGNFTLPLARAGADVVAVERNRRAAVLGRSNARRAGIAPTLYELTDEQALGTKPLPEGWLESMALTDFETVLLDPPRSGARETVRVLAQRGPERVIYISCDAATLARDVAELRTGGYSPVHVEAFDMFPQTPHVEVMIVMERARGA